MDCSKTINFLMAQKKLCSSQGYCQQRNKNDNCPLYAFCNRSPNNYSVAKVKEAIEAMQKWIDEHPGKTYAQDFFKKFPEAKPDAYGVPRMCRANCYGGSCRQPSSIDSNQEMCKCCWDEPMEVIDDE